MRALALLTLLTLAACTPIATSEEAERIALIGWNATGLTSWSPDDWVRLADAGCRGGAWDHDEARRLADEALRGPVDAQQSLAGLTDDDLAGVVWLVTIERCRDRFPHGAIDLGPPGLR